MEKSGHRAQHAARQRQQAKEQQSLSPFWDCAPRSLEPKELPTSQFCVYVAPRHYVRPLLEELGERVLGARGRLVLARGTQPAAWAQNIWYNPTWIPIQSIGDAIHHLKAQQRNWRAHIPVFGVDVGFRRRLTLIEEGLPHITRRPFSFGSPLPTAPLGVFTLWRHDLLLAAAQTHSPFADGEIIFAENKVDPPGRAYLKLWEIFTLLGIAPKPGELCLDFGAAPGGWSWVLGTLGARVFSIDKAPLAPLVAAMPTVNSCQGSGFGLRPEDVGCVDWLFSDMICYPERLLGIVEQWIAAKACRNIICTLKFQAETDHEIIRRFAAIPGGRLYHLSCNKHELTFVKTA